jgi:hypothetical protein
MDIDSRIPSLAPLQRSHDANTLEAELKQLVLFLFETHLRDAERELNVYGVPHLGSLSLIERHVKREGLALIRTEEQAMRYLYKAWRARNPKRGLHFLRMYLQLLWPNGWIVEQLWQDKNKPYQPLQRQRCKCGWWLRGQRQQWWWWHGAGGQPLDRYARRSRQFAGREQQRWEQQRHQLRRRECRYGGDH